MADPPVEARIRDLKRRLELDPGSRLFVALAEEYRKTGRLAEALSTLQKGLLAHPNYLSAQVALGRAYLEAGQITEAIAAFSKTLAADPGNLVSARSLADIYLSRGESVEAIKKFKLYRALSGDRSVDKVIERLEIELAPPPPPPTAAPADVPPPPPPTFFDRKGTGPVRLSRDPRFAPPVVPASSSAPFDETSVTFEPDDSAGRRPASAPETIALLSRDVPLPSISRKATPAAAAVPAAEVCPTDLPAAPDRREEVATPRLAPAPAVSPSHPTAETISPRAEETSSMSGESRGRILADLYFAQGHFTEALQIYDELVAADPFDKELKRMRREAEARLLPAASTPGGDSPDPGLQRRLAKIRVLKRWLSVVQTG